MLEELKDKVKRQEKGLNNRADSIIRQAKEKAHSISVKPVSLNIIFSLITL